MRMRRIQAVAAAHLLGHRVNQHCGGVWRRIFRRFPTIIECAHVAWINFRIIGSAIGVIALRWRHLRILEQFHAAEAGIFVDIAGAPATIDPKRLFAIYIHHHVAAINHARYCMGREGWNETSTSCMCTQYMSNILLLLWAESRKIWGKSQHRLDSHNQPGNSKPHKVKIEER